MPQFVVHDQLTVCGAPDTTGFGEALIHGDAVCVVEITVIVASRAALASVVSAVAGYALDGIVSAARRRR